MSGEIQELRGFEDQKVFKNFTGPTSRGIDVKVYDKCLMCSGFEPRDGAKESGKARKYILNSCSHSSLFPGEILLRSSWSSSLSLPFRTWKTFFSHQKTDSFNVVSFSLTLPSTTTMTWRTRKKRGWQDEREREKESEISLQALVSSRPLALPHWDFVYRRT